MSNCCNGIGAREQCQHCPHELAFPPLDLPAPKYCECSKQHFTTPWTCNPVCRLIKSDGSQRASDGLAYRTQHFNESDAPAMMGCSPYKTRSQLLHEMHTGLTPEVDAGTQRRFDDGHRCEALARPLAEEIIGEEIYPVTGSDGLYSASFDGLTMCEAIGFGHKSLNAELRALVLDQCLGSELPMVYRTQMEQQCMVSGAQRILFMASTWDVDTLIEARDCWYTPDSKLRSAIVAGWAQFKIDLDAYVLPAVPVLIVAEQVQGLPAVLVQVSGEIVVKDNFAAFETALRDFLKHRLIRAPKTDQNFADLDVQIKALKGAEAALESAETQMLAHVQTIDQAKKTKDMLAKLVCENRLMAEKLLASEKDRRRSEIVQKGRAAYDAHIAMLTQKTGGPWIMLAPPDFAGKVKGLRTIASMQDAVDTPIATPAANVVPMRAAAAPTNTGPPTVREQLNAHLDQLSDEQLQRVMSFVKSRYSAA